MAETHDTTIGGRPARVTTIRVAHQNKAWGFYNRHIVRFTDTNECLSMGAAQFEKWARKMDRVA